MLPSELKAIFNNRIDKAKCDSTLISAVKDHERVGLFLNNLSLEITKADVKYRVKYGKNLNYKTIVEIVEGFADNFLANVKRYQDEAHMSVLEKIRLEDAAKKIDNMESAITDNKLVGEYAELEGSVKIGKSKTKGETR